MLVIGRRQRVRRHSGHHGHLAIRHHPCEQDEADLEGGRCGPLKHVVRLAGEDVAKTDRAARLDVRHDHEAQRRVERRVRESGLLRRQAFAVAADVLLREQA